MPPPGQPTRMAPKLAAGLIAVLLAIAFFAGCASPTIPSGTGGTQAPTAGGGQSTAGGSQGSIYSGPVVTPPESFSVIVQESRNHNPIHPDITVAYRGGQGQYLLKKLVVVMVPSTGTMVTKEIDQPESGQIPVGDSVTFTTATTGVDRVIVIATLVKYGDFKILDMQDDYNSHP